MVPHTNAHSDIRKSTDKVTHSSPVGPGTRHALSSFVSNRESGGSAIIVQIPEDKCTPEYSDMEIWRCRFPCSRTHKWTWSEAEPFPPLAHVLASPLWASHDYGALRTKLLAPVPCPVVSYSDTGFVTVDTAVGGATASATPPSSGSSVFLRRTG